MTAVEIIARGIVRSAGGDPDQKVDFQRQIGGEDGRPSAWQQQVKQAESIWAERTRPVIPAF
jgi:hypothetical protein